MGINHVQPPWALIMFSLPSSTYNPLCMYLPAGRQEDVARLDVPVHLLVAVEIEDGVGGLAEDVRNHALRQTLSEDTTEDTTT